MKQSYIHGICKSAHIFNENNINSLQDYLKTAEKTKNAKMIMAWRQFADRNIIPLVHISEHTIRNNSHLLINSIDEAEEIIGESKFRHEFADFLNRCAYQQLIAENWKSCEGILDEEHQLEEKDFDAELNGVSAFSTDEDFKTRIEKINDMLRKKQAKYRAKFSKESEKNAILKVVSTLKK